MRFTKVLISSAVVVAAFSGTQAVAAGPTLSDVLGNSGITVGGAFDVSYDWSPNDQVGSFGYPLPGHVFDTEDDGFSFHQANLTVSKAFAGGVGATLNVLAGDDAQVIGGSDEFTPVQAFVSWSAGNFSVMGGRFVTLAGMEVINSAGNLNAGRSQLFFYQPLVHEGVRASYKVNDLVSVSLGLNNKQFDVTEADDNNSDTTIEAQIALTPLKNLSVYLTGYTGNEDNSEGGELGEDDADLRSDTLDLVVNFNLTDAIYLGLNADYFNNEVDGGGEGGGGSAEAHGVAGYAGWKFMPTWRAAVRAEYLRFDIDFLVGGDSGSAGDHLYAREFTVTLAKALTENLEILVEGRHDKVSDEEIYFPIDGTVEDEQYTATLKAILKF